MPVKERTVSSEELIKLNPDVVFVVYFSDEMKQDIYETFRSPMYSSLKIVKNNRIYPISLYDMYATGVRTAMVFNSFEMVCILICVNDIKSEPVSNLLFCPMLPLLVDW